MTEAEIVPQPDEERRLLGYVAALARDGWITFKSTIFRVAVCRHPADPPSPLSNRERWARLGKGP